MEGQQKYYVDENGQWEFPLGLRQLAMVQMDLNGRNKYGQDSGVGNVGNGLRMRFPIDRQRLEQVMMNILGNAIKYTPDGGHIRVTAGAGDDTVWMEVCDDGIGIPEKDRERIFDRFYRVDKARSRESGGTGLGLSIVKHAVQDLGGAIHLDSTPGQGTSIRVTIPNKET